MKGTGVGCFELYIDRAEFRASGLEDTRSAERRARVNGAGLVRLSGASAGRRQAAAARRGRVGAALGRKPAEEGTPGPGPTRPGRLSHQTIQAQFTTSGTARPISRLTQSATPSPAPPSRAQRRRPR